MSQPTSVPSQAWRLPRRVAYVVNHSYPYSSDGYAVRTHEVARALTKLGHEVIVFNRPGRPWDIEGFSKDIQVKTEQVIDGVRYVFLPSDSNRNMQLRARIRLAEKVLVEAFEVFRPGAVMAVSNWENAEPAQYAARRQGVPFFYELRGFWEMTRAICDPSYEGSEDYEREREREIRISQAAQAVFTLGTSMRDELINRGVSKEKIHLVPNGVSPPKISSVKIGRKEIGSTSKYLLGYVGSLNEYEGSLDLLRLLSTLRKDKVDVDLVIVGSGAPKGLIGSTHINDVEKALRAEVNRLSLGEHVHFVPQVEQNQIGAYYSMVDAVIMPRHRTPVTELVPPIKPYTAATYGVPVFMSDLAPLVEIAEDIHGSIYPEGNIEKLTGMVRHTLEHGGHPAVTKPLRPNISWQNRVAPMVRALQAAANTAPSLSDVFAPAHSEAKDQGDVLKIQKERFDTHILPRVALRGSTGLDPVAAIGPCRHLPVDTKITRLTRVNLLSELAAGDVGCFIIDWAGLRGTSGEWQELWSIENMRLNRQIMDACRIALDRGWRLQVIGPVQRSKAPLFRTVASILEEIQPPQTTPENDAFEQGVDTLGENA